jgi:hypothetical protein
MEKKSEYPCKHGGLPGFGKDNSIAPKATGSKKSGTIEKVKTAPNSIWPVADGSKTGGSVKAMPVKPNKISPTADY